MNDSLCSSLTATQRFLRDLLSSAPGTPASVPEGVRWEDFLRQVEGLALAPFVAYRLRQHAEGVPERVRERIFAGGRANALRQMLRRAALQRVAESFDRAPVPLLVVKGMALAYLAYPEPYCRSMDDIDLVVPRAQVEAAVQAVRDLGFREWRLAFRPGGLSFASADGLVHLEIHGSLDSFEEFGVDSGSLWERSRPADLGGVRVRVLCPEDFVQHLCLHVGPHHHYLSRLQWLLDFRFYLEKHGAETDWRSVAERSVQIGSSPWVYLTLWLAQEFLGAPVPAAFFQSCPAPQRLRDLSRVALQHLLFLGELPMDSSFVKLCAGGSLRQRWEALTEHWRAVRLPKQQGPASTKGMRPGGYLWLFANRVRFLVRSGALRPSAWRAAAGYRASEASLLQLMREEAKSPALGSPVALNP